MFTLRVQAKIRLNIHKITNEHLVLGLYTLENQSGTKKRKKGMYELQLEIIRMVKKLVLISAYLRKKFSSWFRKVIYFFYGLLELCGLSFGHSATLPSIYSLL